MDEDATMAKLLILEDEVMVAMDMERTLMGAGHSIAGLATSERQAMDVLEENPPDAAFLDVNLGEGQNSLAVARRLREDGVPFAFLTGYATSGHAVADEFPETERLAKPCSPGTLLNAAQRLLTTTPA